MRAPQKIVTLREHSLEEIAEQTHARLQRGKGTQVIHVRDDGRVRVLLEDRLGPGDDRGVVGHFSRRHTYETVLGRLRQFLDQFPHYLHPSAGE